MASLFFAIPVTATAPIQSPFTTLVEDMALVAPKQPLEREIDYTLKNIAACESGGDLRAKNPHSTATGKYQFLLSSWEHYGKQLWGESWVTKDIFSEHDQDDLAYFVVERNHGYGDWLASYDCWGNLQK